MRTTTFFEAGPLYDKDDNYFFEGDLCMSEGATTFFLDDEVTTFFVSKGTTIFWGYLHEQGSNYFFLRDLFVRKRQPLFFEGTSMCVRGNTLFLRGNYFFCE
jgi:hypothetical protein